jgi:DNA-binding response OmpR family regulator
MLRDVPKKALLVDGPDNRRLFRRFLQLHGFEVRECDTFEEALPIVPVFLPDLMVTELSKGVEPALAECRDLVGSLPVLFHGGTVSEWEARGKSRNEDTAFLPRPFSVLDFHLTIQRLLRS